MIKSICRKLLLIDKTTLLVNKGWGGQSWTWMFFSMYRPSCFIEAHFRPEKYWLVCVGLLANHVLNSNFIYPSGGSGGMSSSFCWYLPPLAGPIPLQWTDIGRSNRHQLLSRPLLRCLFGEYWFRLSRYVYDGNRSFAPILRQSR